MGIIIPQKSVHMLLQMTDWPGSLNLESNAFSRVIIYRTFMAILTTYHQERRGSSSNKDADNLSPHLRLIFVPEMWGKYIHIYEF